jgi:hypothetical protein
MGYGTHFTVIRSNPMPEQKPKVVVTTKHRGVFFGTLESRDGREVVLSDARVCVHWSAKTRGVNGLAATGPLEGSRVSKAAPRQDVLDITSILYCSAEAIKQWESEPWS